MHFQLTPDKTRDRILRLTGMKNEWLKSGYTCMEQCLNEQIYEGWWNIHGWTTDSVLTLYEETLIDTVVELIIGQLFIKMVIFRGNYMLLINWEWGHYRIVMSYQGRGLRFPCNDQMDKINKLLILLYGLFFMDLSRQSTKNP